MRKRNHGNFAFGDTVLKVLTYDCFYFSLKLEFVEEWKRCT